MAFGRTGNARCVRERTARDDPARGRRHRRQTAVAEKSGRCAAAPALAPIQTAKAEPAAAPEAKPAATLTAPGESAAPYPAPTPEPTNNPTLEKLDPNKPVDSGAAQPSAMALPGINQMLVQKSDAGPVPIPSSDGTTPWRYYARPFEHKGSTPMVAIIIVGLGKSKNVAESATKLPEDFTLSFSPYAKDMASWVIAARTAGHETMVDLPLEPADYPATDPGPYGLLAGKGLQENATRLQWLMSRSGAYTGFVAPSNEVFSANDEAFKGLLQSLSDHGLLLLLAHDPGKAETRQAIDNGSGAVVAADELVDEELSAAAIQVRLASLEQTAKDRGYAIGIAQAYPITIQQLAAWSAKLREHGVVLAPVSFIARIKFS